MAKTAVACKNCGTENLMWNKTAKGWRLFDENGDQHRCSAEVTFGKPTKTSGPVAAVPSSEVKKLTETVADLILKVDDLGKAVEALEIEVLELKKDKPKKGEQLNLFGPDWVKPRD